MHGAHGKHGQSHTLPSQRKRDGIAIIASPAKTVAIPPKSSVPTAQEVSAEEKSRLARANARIAGEERVAAAGVPTDTEEYAVKRAVGAAKHGGVDCLAQLPGRYARQENRRPHCYRLPRAEDELYLERALDTATPLQTCRRADNGVQTRRMSTSSKYRWIT